MRVFDSNILIYYLNGIFSPDRKTRIDNWVRQEAFISVISRIEVLGFSQPDRERRRARDFVALFQEVSLTENIVQTTISVRRRHPIKVPDAIIAATALELNFSLVTRNTSDFKGIEGLSLVNPFED